MKLKDLQSQIKTLQNQLSAAAATKIQAISRGRISRRKSKIDKVKMKSGVRKIQKSWRKYRVRKSLKNIPVEKSASSSKKVEGNNLDTLPKVTYGGYNTQEEIRNQEKLLYDVLQEQLKFVNPDYQKELKREYQLERYRLSKSLILDKESYDKFEWMRTALYKTVCKPLLEWYKSLGQKPYQILSELGTDDVVKPHRFFNKIMKNAVQEEVDSRTTVYTTTFPNKLMLKLFLVGGNIVRHEIVSPECPRIKNPKSENLPPYDVKFCPNKLAMGLNGMKLYFSKEEKWFVINPDNPTDSAKRFFIDNLKLNVDDANWNNKRFWKNYIEDIIKTSEDVLR